MISWCWPLVGLWCKLGFCSCTVLLQKRPVRESTQRQMSCSSSGSLSPSNQAANAPKQTGRREWKYIASEKTTSKCVCVCVWTACVLSSTIRNIWSFFWNRFCAQLMRLKSEVRWLQETWKDVASEFRSLSLISKLFFFPQVAPTISNLTPRQHLPVFGCAGRCVVCDLLARSQQPSDLSLCHPLPDEEPQLRGPARGAGGATALTHALCSLRPGHRSPEWKTHRSRWALNRVRRLE